MVADSRRVSCRHLVPLMPFATVWYHTILMILQFLTTHHRGRLFLYHYFDGSAYDTMKRFLWIVPSCIIILLLVPCSAGFSSETTTNYLQYYQRHSPRAYNRNSGYCSLILPPSSFRNSRNNSRRNRRNNHNNGLLTTTSKEDDLSDSQLLHGGPFQHAVRKFKARPGTYLLIPCVAAVVGWFTNWLAVQMIFYPIQFRGIPLKRWEEVPLGLFGWQGIVPCKTRPMTEASKDK
jgi:hypothetical protein